MIRDAPCSQSVSRSHPFLPDEPTPITFTGFRYQWPGSRPPEHPVDENENIRQLLAHFHQAEQARLGEAQTKLRAEVIPKRLRLRVANAEVASSGCGDSGAIDGTQFRDQAGLRVDRASLPPDVTFAVRVSIVSIP